MYFVFFAETTRMKFYDGWKKVAVLLKEEIESSGVDYVRFAFADIHGIPRGKIVTSSAVESCLVNGLNVSLGALFHGPGGELTYLPQQVRELGSPDSLFIPRPSTYQVLPWASTARARIGQVLCEQHLKSDLSCTHSPRTLARRQLMELEKLKLSLLSGCEHEFMLLSKDGQTHLMPTEQGLSLFDFLGHSEIIYDIANQLAMTGVKVQMIHREHGPSQFELICEPQFGVRAPDESFLVRDAIMSIAKKRDIMATFMTKPFESTYCNSSHFNHSLWSLQDGNNVQHGVMYDQNECSGLSEVARWWIGGIISHAPAITAFCCPTVNCYRRIGGVGVPPFASWCFEGRYAMLRVKMGGENGTYIENRLPSGMANQYLVLAVTVAAGIDGILNKIEPPKPFTEDDAHMLPRNLSDALAALENDKVIVDALGKEFVEGFCGAKRAYETKLEGEEESCDIGSQLQEERKTYMYHLG